MHAAPQAKERVKLQKEPSGIISFWTAIPFYISSQ